MLFQTFFLLGNTKEDIMKNFSVVCLLYCQLRVQLIYCVWGEGVASDHVEERPSLNLVCKLKTLHSAPF